MKVVIAGLGIQGRKRLKVAGADAVATVDPVSVGADYRRIEDVPREAYEAALVCVPDREKAPLLEYLLSHGKHVLVEKPLLADQKKSLVRLRELALAKRVACYTAYNHRFEPHILRLKEVLDARGLGIVYSARFFYGNGTARDVRESNWRDQGLGVLGRPGLASPGLERVSLRTQRLRPAGMGMSPLRKPGLRPLSLRFRGSACTGLRGDAVVMAKHLSRGRLSGSWAAPISTASASGVRASSP